jgi:hypothetical protein
MAKKRAPRDYSKGKVYKLECLNTGKVYVGHTTKQYLSQRLALHKQAYTQWLRTNKKYMTSFEILKGGNFTITLLESYPCSSEDELKARERHWIETIENVNRYIPTRTFKEYLETNRDTILQWHRDNYQRNRDSILSVKRDYWMRNKEAITLKRQETVVCECGMELRKVNLTRHRMSQRHQSYFTSLTTKP